MKNVLTDNYELHEVKDNLELDLNSLKQNNNDLKDKVHSMQIEHQRSLEQLREEMMSRYYSAIEEQESNYNHAATMKRLEEKQKKNYEKKIIDLTKTNRQISHEAEMWRRKCNVVQEKYQNIRSLLSKDKGIGRQAGDESITRDKKTKMNSSMLDEINEMASQLDSLKLKKTMTSGEEGLRNSLQMEKKQEGPGFQYSVNKWECIAKLDAHNSSVLSIATHANMLISASTKSLKIWDL